MTAPAALLLRPANVADVPAMLAIYEPIVQHTAISFELEPPSPAEFEQRLAKYSADWAWIVGEIDGAVVGYAYGSPHRERAAYRWSTETSAYVAEAARRNGVGAALYRALLPRLAARGYCNAYAGIALPNPASVALHQSVGFRPIGVFPSVGRKFGQWHDVGWFHCPLHAAPPDEPSAPAREPAAPDRSG
jgi:L-amino acid N-acyltransferase YncA